jgi:hypothetical protein
MSYGNLLSLPTTDHSNHCMNLHLHAMPKQA